jgi:hypothetical protein
MPWAVSESVAREMLPAARFRRPMPGLHGPRRIGCTLGTSGGSMSHRRERRSAPHAGRQLVERYHANSTSARHCNTILAALRKLRGGHHEINFLYEGHNADLGVRSLSFLGWPTSYKMAFHRFARLTGCVLRSSTRDDAYGLRIHTSWRYFSPNSSMRFRSLCILRSAKAKSPRTN